MDPKSLRSSKRRRGEFHGVDIENLELPGLKDMCLETDLAEPVLVVPPETEGGREIADRIVEILGPQTEVRSAADVRENDYDAAHMIVAGNVHTNGVMRHLGMNFYSWTDDYFPGRDGYEVRTVHNPFGSGKNCVILGGSTPEGVERAADSFVGVLEREGSRLGRVNRVESSHLPKRPPSDAEVRETIQRVNEYLALSGSREPLWHMVDHGMAYYLTGQEEWGRMFREEFLFFIDLVDDFGDWALAKGTNVYFWGYNMMTAWDVVEEGEVLSDADRLRMSTALYNMMRWTSAMGHFRYDSLDQVEQHQNHQTFGAITLFMGARYFKKYYGITEFDEQLPVIQRIMDLHVRSYKPNDNALGCVWLTPGHVIQYQLITGNLTYLEDGHLARLLDSVMLTIDSRGEVATYGDTGGSGGPKPTRPGGLHAAALGAWFYNDGRYRWLYDLMRRGQEWEDAFEHLTVGKLGGWEVYHGFFYKDIPPVEPVDLLGVRAAMLDRPIYELALHDIRKKAGRQTDPTPDIDVPLEEAFDKLSFRGSFDRRSEYMMFNGPTGFAHCHEDGNAIIRLCWNDRIWLADLDPIRRLARYHNSVVIVKDGACNPKPLQTALKATADFDGWGFSRTQSAPDNGTRWGRNVLWRKGRYFLVIDTIEALDRGEFILDCIWRVLGEVQADGNRLDVEQEGERFHIVQADGSDRWLTDREADYAPDWVTNWQGYEHAGQTVHMWHQTKRMPLERGGRAAYVNLLYPSNDEMNQAFSVEQVGESVVRVKDKTTGDAEILGTADGGLRSGDLTVEAKLFRVDGRAFSLVEGIALSCGSPLFRSWDPVCIELDLAKGEGVIQTRVETRVGLRAADIRLDGEAVSSKGEGGLTWFTVPTGRHRIEVEPGSHGLLDGCPEAAGPFADAYDPPRRPAVPRRGLEPVWQFKAGSCVKAAAWDEGGQMLVGTSAGSVHLLDEAGHEAWSYDGGSEIRDVHLADIDGDGVSEAIVGTRESRLAVLDGKGTVRWDHVFPPGGSKIRPQRVMKVCTADLDGDGGVQVLAGTEGWLLHAFEPDGTLRWETEIRYWAVTGLLATDLNGDGKDELLIGTEYYAINCFNPDGSFRWIQNTGCVGPTILAADLDGDGEPEVVYGDWRAVSAVRWDKGERLWRVNMGGETEDIAIADVDGDGRPEVIAGSDIGQLVCVRGEGEVAWRRDLMDKITWLTALDADGDGKAEIVVGFDTGEIRVYDGEGRMMAGRRVDDEVTVLRAVAGAEGETIVCATAAGTVTALRPGW